MNRWAYILPVCVQMEQNRSIMAILQSAGAFQLGIHANPGKKLALHGWDLFVENIFNAAMIQADYRLPLKGKQSVLISVMGIRQDILHNGETTIRH